MYECLQTQNRNSMIDKTCFLSQILTLENTLILLWLKCVSFTLTITRDLIQENDNLLLAKSLKYLPDHLSSMQYIFFSFMLVLRAKWINKNYFINTVITTDLPKMSYFDHFFFFFLKNLVQKLRHFAVINF